MALIGEVRCRDVVISASVGTKVLKAPEVEAGDSPLRVDRWVTWLDFSSPFKPLA